MRNVGSIRHEYHIRPARENVADCGFANEATKARLWIMRSLVMNWRNLRRFSRYQTRSGCDELKANAALLPCEETRRRPKSYVLPIAAMPIDSLRILGAL
jgi:hypothetical protein